MKRSLSILSSFLVILLMSSQMITAQSNEMKKLSLAVALSMAKENNRDIKIAESEVDMYRADKNKSLAAFLPQVTLSETFIRTNDPLNVFGFKLKQEIVQQSDFNPMLLNDPNIINNFTTKAEIRQPLLNFDGFFGRAAAANALDAMEFKKVRTENYIKFQVKYVYYQLVLSKISLEVVGKALTAAKATQKVTKDYYDKGFITRADYLMAEVFLTDTESKHIEANNNYQTVSQNLANIIGLESYQIIEPTDKLEYDQFEDVQNNYQSIYESRSDMLSYSSRVDAMRNMVKMNYSKILPRLNAFGSYDFNSKDAFGTNAKAWMVGLNLQWNVFNGFQNIASIQKSKAALDNAELEFEKAKSQSRLDLDETLGNLETIKKKLTLAKKALEQSDESLKIMKDRYNQGLEKTSDVLLAETGNTNSNFNYINALFFYNLTVAKLELLLEKKLEIK